MMAFRRHTAPEARARFSPSLLDVPELSNSNSPSPPSTTPATPTSVDEGPEYSAQPQPFVAPQAWTYRPLERRESFATPRISEVDRNNLYERQHQHYNSHPGYPTFPPIMMDRTRGLPADRAFGQPAGDVPQYLTETEPSTDSTGSADSILTQVPLPYHMSANTSFGAQASYGTTQDLNASFGNLQIGGQATAFATPELPSTSTFGYMPQGGGQGTTSLNPTSTPYVPAGFPPEYSPMISQGTFQDENNGMMGQQYQRGQIGMQQYQGSMNGGGQYSQLSCQPTGISARTLADPRFQAMYGMNQTPTPYGHYSAAAGMSSSSYVDYGPTRPGSMLDTYPPPQRAPVQTFQSLGYGSGDTGSTAASSYTSQGYPAGYGENGYTNYQIGQSNNNYGMHSRNRHTGNHINRKPVGGPSGMQQSSNLVTAPVLSYNNETSKVASRSSTPTLGGPVQAPSKAVRISSPDKSDAASSARDKSPERRFQTSEANNTNGGLATPSQKSIHPRDLQCASESRNGNTETPTLRSRRGQSVSTDAARNKNNVANWLDQTPTQATFESNATASQAAMNQPPPKMLNLLPMSAGSGMLTPITEGDPFHTPNNAARAAAFNPFTSPPPITPLNSGAAGYGMLGSGYVEDGGYDPLRGYHMASAQFRAFTENGTKNRPHIDVVLDPKNLPFVEYCRLAKDDNGHGVIKISNIPYSVNRQEVLAFLGRNARVISEYDGEPVHIVMERVTSKTLDCYVEFVSFNEAVNAVNRFEVNRTGGRGGRLGQRHVEVELSSQEHLMKDMFPKAKNVTWQGGRPRIIPRDPNDRYNSGFQGFVSKEELVMLVKHVEAPQRSPFSKDCPQRPFECLISTLLKYPWYMVDFITIEDRNLLHRATVDLLRILIDRVAANNEDIHLNSMLLKRVWKAALKCPGFTPAQKDDIVYYAGLDDQVALEHGMAPYASYWKVLWCIGPKPNAPMDMIVWYCGLIREATQSKQKLSLAEQAAKVDEMEDKYKLFGELQSFIKYPPNYLTCTLAQVAAAEWAAIEEDIRRHLTPALE